MSKSDREHLEGYLDDVEKGDAIAEIWQLDDILSAGEEIGYTLTPAQGRDILSLLSRKHDANLGINWEVIHIWISEYMHEED